MLTRFRLRPLLATALVLLITASSSFAQPATAPAEPPPIPHGTFSQRLQSLFGLLVITLIAFGIGKLRARGKSLPLRTIVWGFVLQFAFGAIVVWNRYFLVLITNVVQALLDCTKDGASLVFGDLSVQPGPAVYDSHNVVIGYAHQVGYFAFFIVPTIIFFSCLTAVLYHSGIMQYVVQGLAWTMSKTMGTSGAETLSSAANIFVGQTEAPLMVKPFIATATSSELMAIMVAGFANIASGVLGLYTTWLAPYVPDAAGHLAAACFITAPGSLLIAKLMVPEDSIPDTAGGVQFKITKIDANLIDAAARGTTEGLGLGLNVAAMLIAFTALVALVNKLFAWSSLQVGITHPLTLEIVLGWIFRPLAWLIGVSWQESPRVGSLLGIKTVLNELIAYSKMKDELGASANYLSPRSALLATYALCGFANFASVGIQVGGIASLAPSRRADLSRIGLLAMVGGALASLMAACIVGILV